MHAGTLASNDGQVVRTFQEHKLDGWMHTLGAKVVNPAYKTFAKAKNAVFSLFSKGKAAPAA